MANSHAICAKTGLELTVTHFPYSFNKGQISHPIFSLGTRELIALTPLWTGRKLTTIESSLMFLALLNSTGLVEFRTYARPAPEVVENNMESLLRITTWIYNVKHPALLMAKFAITQDTATLSNISHWMDIWFRCRKEFEDGYKEYQTARTKLIKESALEKLIKTPNKTPENYANSLADWAALAGNFPVSMITVNNKAVSIKDYWKSIIKLCGTKGNVWRIDTNDIQELLEHCEDRIDAGNIYANALFRLLRNALKRQDGFMMMVDNDNELERANIAAVVATAPTSLPIASDYATHIDYLRAKNAYNLAQSSMRRELEAEAALVKKLEVLEELNNYVDDSEAYADELITINNGSDNFNDDDTITGEYDDFN